MNLTAGTVLQNGKYVLDSPLGQSALGITFKATQTRLHQTVVVKTLRSQPQTDLAHLKQRFIDEARRFAQCQHPGLARVLEVFEEAGLPFVVMDYVAGQTLAEQVRSRAPLPEAQAMQSIRQAGSALSVMHRQGVLHRDVKPDNLVRPQGAAFVVLVGFGMAHYAVLGVPDTKSLPSAYAAIELHKRQVNLTPATDIYALAATLYFLVTGQEPIDASHRQQSPLIAPRQLQPHLSAAIDHAILSGMALNAHDRPQTIAAWFALLPDNRPLAAVQGFATGDVQPHPAIDLPHAAAIANGSGRPTSPSAPPTTTTQAAYANVSLSPKPSLSLPSTPKSKLPKALVMAAAIASAAGLGLGLALRLSAVTGIGPTFLQTQQDFPPQQNWPLQEAPTAFSTAPALPEPLPVSNQPAPVRQPRVKVLPSPLPSPVEPEPSPTATIEASPIPASRPGEPPLTPSPLPNPALPTNPTPRALPSVQSPLQPPVLPIQPERLPSNQSP